MCLLIGVSNALLFDDIFVPVRFVEFVFGGPYPGMLKEYSQFSAQESPMSGFGNLLMCRNNRLICSGLFSEVR